MAVNASNKSDRKIDDGINDDDDDDDGRDDDHEWPQLVEQKDLDDFVHL